MVATIGGLPVFDALITDDECGMLKISLVDSPAVMSNFQAFDSNKKAMLYAVADEDKRLVRGCVMRCDFPIYRCDEMGEYYIIYKADEIRKMAEKYLVEGRSNIVNLNHTGNDIEGVQMVQYFIKGDGVSVEGFDDCADGSLFAEFHIVNDEVWEAVKQGTYKGFSLEGVFDLKGDTDIAKTNEIVDSLDGAFSRIFKHSSNNTMSKLSRLKEALAKALQEYGNITTDKGILAWEGDEDLAVNDQVFIEDAEGNRTPAEDGEYSIADAPQVIIVSGGVVADIKDAEVSVEPIAEPEAEATTEAEAEEEKKEDEQPTEEAPTTEEEAPEAEAEPTQEEEAPQEDKDAKIAELEETIKALQEEIARLTAENEAMQKMSIAKPAHEEIEASSAVKKTGNKGLDNLVRILSAK